MLKLKEIERILDSKGVQYDRWENNQGISIYRPCEILTEESLFGYFDSAPAQVIREEFSFLDNDSRIYIGTCETCCGCGDW